MCLFQELQSPCKLFTASKIQFCMIMISVHMREVGRCLHLDKLTHKIKSNVDSRNVFTYICRLYINNFANELPIHIRMIYRNPIIYYNDIFSCTSPQDRVANKRVLLGHSALYSSLRFPCLLSNKCHSVSF